MDGGAPLRRRRAPKLKRLRISCLMSKKHHESTSPKKKRKKVPFFYKFHISILLVAALLLAYFLLLVPMQPKSLFLVTEKIEKVLQEKLRTDVSLSQSYISFTYYGTLKVAATSLKILYALPNSSEKQAFVIPRLESEFSLLKILMMRFEPTNIKVVSPTIVVDDLRKFQSSPENSGEPNPVIKFLAMIRSGDFPIESFNIENATVIAKGENLNTEILVKKSQIRTEMEGETLFVSSVNTLNFDKKKSDVNLNSNCRLNKNDGLKCDIFLEHFVTDSVAGLHPSLEVLNRINTTLNASASFVFKEGKMGDVLFTANAQNGDFNFPAFFSEKIIFSDFSVRGNYDSKLENLNLSEIKTYLVENAQAQVNKATAPYLDMTLLISELKDPQKQGLDFYIKLQNTPLDKMDKFWPVSLNHQGIRDWVIGHIKGGMLNEGSTKFSLQKNGEEFLLNDIEAKINFTGTNLDYDAEFPAIANINGSADFTKNDMKIALSSGDVLKSKISEGLIAIDDFNAPVTMLKISGKSQGHAADSLKHVDHKSPEFIVGVEKYLNGNSQNDFDIRLPLGKNVELKDVYIAVNSKVMGVKNDYLQGDAKIQTRKDFASNNFITSIDLGAAELDVKAIDLTKKAGVESGLNLIVAVKDAKKIQLKNIELWQKEAKKNIAKITADLEFETAPFLLRNLELKNNNFGKNNYALTYKTDKKTAMQRISLRAQQLNFTPFLEKKSLAAAPTNKNFPNSQIQVAVNNISLLRNKSVKNLYLSLSCKNGFCGSGIAKGNYGKKQLFDLRTVKNPADNSNMIEGRVFDIGYLAEALGLSNTVSGGEAEIKIQNKIVKKKQVFAGQITVDEDVTIYENAVVKRLSKNDLFSQVKDKIFSNDKTTFSSVKIDFALRDKHLELKSLLANNYKIGITAKGTLDLQNNTYQIKGMIIPGFIINNLFGIGKIPILGNVISGLLTGGEGGGVFGIRYEYSRAKGATEPTFETYKVSAFVPTTIKNLFDSI